jgi:hypothetical protein
MINYFYEKMKILLQLKFLILLTFLLLSCSDIFAEKLVIQVDGYCLANNRIELGYYYGTKTYLKDTITINSNGTAEYSSSYREGIYFILFPDASVYEFMITNGTEYKFSISQNQGNFTVAFKSNPVAEAYDLYNARLSHILSSMDSLKSIRAHLVDPSDIKMLDEKMAVESGKIDTLRSQYIFQFRGSFLETYLLALTPVDIKRINKSRGLPDTDSMQLLPRLKLYQDHYLDNINFNDERLIYTPVLTEKIVTYLEKIVAQQPDTLTRAIDKMLTEIGNKEVLQFLLKELDKKYRIQINKPIYEYVYAHLIEKYFLTGAAPWLSTEQIDQYSNELKRIKPALIHQTAPEINLRGADNKSYSLHSIKDEYTILIFWDIDCPKCKKIIQDIRTVISKFNYLNIAVYSIYTGTKFEFWRNYVSANTPANWINTYETAKGEIINNYNVSLTPFLFLLDSDKRIVDKGLTANALDSYFLKIATHSK